MRARGKNLVLSRGVGDTMPTAEEVTLRPELLKQMLAKVSEQVDPMDLEHMVVVGITTTGATRLFHSYGRDLPMKEVANMLEDLAAQARKVKR